MTGKKKERFLQLETGTRDVTLPAAAFRNIRAAEAAPRRMSSLIPFGAHRPRA